MTITAAAAPLQEAFLIALPDQPLTTELADYLNQLAAQNRQAPLALTIKVHPLNIAESLARELAAHERNVLIPDKKRSQHEAAHEFCDPHNPQETAAVRQALSNLIAGMAAPLADATLAHHLLFILAFGKNLPPPYAIDRMAICASFDATHGILRQRFAPDRELGPPNEPPVPAGMTMICEPVETGYYRLPDDKRHRNSSGLSMKDALYNWTLQAVLAFYMGLDALRQAGPDAQEFALLLSRQARSIFRLLAMYNPDVDYLASLGGINLQPRNDAFSAPRNPPPRIVVGRFASSGGASQTRNFEHRAGNQMLARNAAAAHYPPPHPIHALEAGLTPE